MSMILRTQRLSDPNRSGRVHADQLAQPEAYLLVQGAVVRARAAGSFAAGALGATAAAATAPSRRQPPE